MQAGCAQDHPQRQHDLDFGHARAQTGVRTQAVGGEFAGLLVFLARGKVSLWIEGVGVREEFGQKVGHCCGDVDEIAGFEVIAAKRKGLQGNARLNNGHGVPAQGLQGRGVEHRHLLAILYSVSAVGSVIDAAATAFEIKAFPARLEELAKVKYPKLDQLDPDTFKAVVSLTNTQMHGINISGLKIGAMGAAIGIGISWALFFSVWGGGIVTGSIEFNRLLAGAISGTLFAVMTFVLSLTVVGAIILAVFAFFDLFAFIACKAGAKKACDLGITEAIIRVMTDWLYTGGVMIDTAGKPPIATIDDLQMRLTDPITRVGSRQWRPL